MRKILFTYPSSRMPRNFAVIADDTRGKGLIKTNPERVASIRHGGMTALLIFFILYSPPRFLIRKSANDHYRMLHRSILVKNW